MEYIKKMDLRLGIMVLYASFVVIATMLYMFASRWNIVFIATTSALSILLTYLLCRNDQKSIHESTTTFLHWRAPVVLIELLGLATLTVFLFHHQTLTSMNSPWNVVSPLAWMIMIPTIFFSFAVSSSWPNIALIALALSIGGIIHPLGFGFDPFVHEAASRALIQQGIIQPKTPYYTGLYLIVATIARLTPIGVHAIIQFLVPLATCLVIWYARERLTPFGRIPATLIFLVPLTLFTTTTPQALGNLFVILVGIELWRSPPSWAITILYVLAAATMHPLSALAATMMIGWWWTMHRPKPMLRAFAATAMIVAAAIAPPILFGATSAFAHALAYIPRSLTLPYPQIWHRTNGLLDIVYTAHAWAPVIVLCIAIDGIRILFPERKTDFLAMLGASLSILIMAWIARFIQFPFIFSTEQVNFSDRLLTLSLYPFIPVVARGASSVWERMSGQRSIVKLSAAFVLTLTIAVQIFFSYPRANDNYTVSHAYSTGQADIDAVRWIDADAHGASYIVLANQAVSAAALKEFGFKQYFKASGSIPHSTFNISHSDIAQPLFYYPIPTGGILYKYFLEMIYHEPTKELALEAMDRAGVDHLYFVVNKYWYGSDRAIDRARQFTPHEYRVDDAVWVFRYDR